MEVRQPVILEEYLESDEVDSMLLYLDKVQKPSYNITMSGALGYRTSVEADAMSMDNPVARLTGTPEDDASILKTTEVILRIKEEMNKYFDMEFALVNCNYTIMHTGSWNGLHADSSELDGSPIPESKELHYSALIYLNSHGEDYEGGKLFFPLQDIEVSPKKGTVVFFKGDYTRPHGVTTVESGDRKALVLFLTNAGNTSDEPLFLHPGAGVPVEELSPEDRARYEGFVEQGLLE